MNWEALQSSRIVQCREIASHPSGPSIEGCAANFAEQQAPEPRRRLAWLSVGLRAGTNQISTVAHPSHSQVRPKSVLCF